MFEFCVRNHDWQFIEEFEFFLQDVRIPTIGEMLRIGDRTFLVMAVETHYIGTDEEDLKTAHSRTVLCEEIVERATLRPAH